MAIAAVGLIGVSLSGDNDPVAAPPRQGAHPRMHPHRDSDGRIMRSARHESETDNWAGYFVAQYQTSASYTAAQSSWTVPSVSYTGASGSARTNSRQYASTWVGIGGVCTDADCTGSGDNTLIQLGTEQDALRFGSNDYYAWYEMLPADTVTLPNPVNPGDRISASVQCTASCSSATQSWTLSMTDFTAGWTWTQTVSYASPMLSAEWIEEATSTCTGSNCTVQPLADFTKVSFGPSTANGTNPFLTLADNGIIMTDTSGQTAQPSSPFTGDEFAACWGQTSYTACGFTPAATPLVASILPSSRSVEIGADATVYASMINAGTAAAQNCSVALGSDLPGTFAFQTTDPATNTLTGSPNVPVNLAPGGTQTFILSFTPTGTFSPTDTDFQFGCANAGIAPIYTGIDTLLLASSATPVPDVVALSATQTNDGILDIVGNTGEGAFAVATVNVGAGSVGQLSVAADTASATLPLTFTLCQTTPAGQCMTTPTQTVSAVFAANAIPSFAVFATASGAIAFDPVNNRIFIRIKDGSGNVHGATSVAVRTQ